MFDFLNKNQQLFIFKIVYKKSVKLSNLSYQHHQISFCLCRYIHQITAGSLYIKKVDAYEKYVSLSTEHPVLPMALWEKRQSCHPMFKFWNLILQLELLLFEFVKSIRSGKLQLYINTLMKIAPWMFSLDHHNYARWLPVHINEVSQLHQNHLGVYEEF